MPAGDADDGRDNQITRKFSNRCFPRVPETNLGRPEVAPQMLQSCSQLASVRRPFRRTRPNLTPFRSTWVESGPINNGGSLGQQLATLRLHLVEAGPSVAGFRSGFGNTWPMLASVSPISGRCFPELCVSLWPAAPHRPEMDEIGPRFGSPKDFCCAAWRELPSNFGATSELAKFARSDPWEGGPLWDAGAPLDALPPFPAHVPAMDRGMIRGIAGAVSAHKAAGAEGWTWLGGPTPWSAPWRTFAAW